MACSHLAPNNEKSILYDELIARVGEAKAHDLWTQVRSQEFLNKYGDWQKWKSDKATADKILAFETKDQFDNNYTKEIEDYLMPKLPEDSMGANDFKLSEIKEMVNQIQSEQKIPLDVNGEPETAWVIKTLATDHGTINRRIAIENMVRNKDFYYKTPADAEAGLKEKRIPITKENAEEALRLEEEHGEMIYDRRGYIIGKPSSEIMVETSEGSATSFRDFKALQQTVEQGQEKARMDDGEWKAVTDKYNELLNENLPHSSAPKEEVRVDAFEKLPKHRITEEQMAQQIKTIYDTARANPDKLYQVPIEHFNDRTRVAKYTTRQLANLFDTGDIPDNIQFTQNMKAVIENSARRIAEQYKSDLTPEFISRNDTAVEATAAELLLPRRNEKGEQVGFFDPTQHKEILDTIRSQTERIYREDPNMKENSILKAIYRVKSVADNFRKKGDIERANTFQSIYDNRVRIVEEVLRQLEAQGLYTDDATISRIVDSVRRQEIIIEKLKSDFLKKNPDIDPESIDVYDGSFQEATGRIARDWSDNTFELDPRDTASGRIKLFMGNQYEMDRGVYTADKDGIQLTETEIGTTNLAKLSEMPWQQQIALARKLSRNPFWFENEAKTKKLREWLEETYPTFTRTNFLGMARTADYDMIYKEVLNTLGNQLQGQNFEEAMALLDAHQNPTVQNIAKELRSADKSMQNEFMSVMSKQYQPFVMALIDSTRTNRGNEYSLRPINANRFNQRDTLIKHWQQQQRLLPITVTNASGERVLDVARINREWMPLLKQATTINDWTLPENKAWFIENIGKILRESGIGVTNEMMNDLHSNPSKWSNSESVTGLFSIRRDGVPAGLLSIFIMKSAGRTVTGEITDIEGLVKQSELNNPLFTETTSMHKLASLVAKYTPVLYSDNHRNVEGKNIYDWGMNTKLSHQFRDFTKNFDGFALRTDTIDIARNNWLVKALSETRKQVKDLELSYFDGMRPEWGKGGTTRAAMSDREQLVMSVLLFQNSGYSHNNKIPKAHYMSLTHADKTMTPVFKNMPRLNTGGHADIPGTVIGRSDSALFNIFKSEFDRIKNQEGITFNNKKYDQGKSLFYFLPDFNYDSMKRMREAGIITAQEFNTIWMGGERKLTSIIDSERELPVINKVLNLFVENLVGNTLNKWQRHKIIDDVNGNIFDKQYVQKLMVANNIRIENKEGKTLKDIAEGNDVVYRDETGQILDRKELNKRIAISAAKDYAINQYLFGTSMSQLFYGDPAEAFKPVKGGTDMDHVESTMKEYAKRLAKDIAPRSDGYWEGDRTFNTITLADVKTTEPYLGDIEALRKYYVDSTTEATDAQEIVTVQEHLDVMHAYGQVPETIYQEMSDIIRRAGPGGYYEFTKPEHLQVIMQPTKPVYSGVREPRNGATLTDYVKSSSYPLYPPFTRGREMDGLRKFMEGNNIQRANYESARKLGGPTVPLEIYTKDGKFIDPVGESWKEAHQTLSRDGFGIQQDVPFDEGKESLKTLTQMNVGITEGIDHIENFTLPGHEGELSGAKMRDMKETVRKEMLRINQREFLNQLNVDENGIIDREKVIDMMAREARKKGYTTNELQSILVREKDGMPSVSIMFNTAADKFEGLMMSMINKIADVKMPGKSYVQASGIGTRMQDSEGRDFSNVIKVGDYDGSPLKILRKENGTIRAAQVILPFNFFDHTGTKLKVSDFITDGKLDMERVPKELLELIGGRIPNQGHSSMLPLEVVGFTPENMGDIAFIPAAVVKQMGADFDVDKLYTYKRPYRYNAESARFEPITPSSAPKEMSELQRSYFDIHWSVLTHPKMIDKVLSPLDKEDLKDESKLLAPKKGGYYNFYDPMTQLEDFQSGKDAKRLVGASSWGSKFNANIQNKRLQYGQLEMKQAADGRVYPSKVPAKIVVHDEITGLPRELTMLSGNGKSTYQDKTGETFTRSKADNHQMIQSESVDNAKYRTLDNLNLTPDTYRAAQAFIQLETEGAKPWSTSSKYWTRLLTQPSIMEFSRLMKEGNDSLSDSYDPNLYRSTINQLRTEYVNQLSDPKLEAKAADVIFDTKLLLDARDMKGDELAIHQIAAIELFDKLYQIGDRMLELESLFNQDVNGAGPNLFTALDKAEKLESIDQLPILNAGELYATEKGERTELGETFDMTVKTANKLISQVFPYHAFKPMMNKLLGSTGRRNLSIDDQRTMLKGFRSFTYTSSDILWADAATEHVRLIYGEDSLAKRLVEAQRTWGKDNPFLTRLKPRIGDNKADADFIEYEAGSKTSSTDKQNAINGWLHLLMNGDEVQRKLAEDLLRYNYLSGGLQDANSFADFVPIAYIANTPFANMLRGTERKLMETGEYENDAFLIQHIQHQPQLARTVDQNLFGKMPFGREYPETFPKGGIDPKNPVGYEKILSETGQPLPFLSYYSRSDGKWVLYMKNDVGDSVYYSRIDTLGNKFTDEYDGLSAGGARSIFPANRSLAERVPGLEGNAFTEIQNLKNNMYSVKPNHQESHFQQIGIESGGEKELRDALKSISTNKAIPEYLRTVSRLLESTTELIATREAKKMADVVGKPLRIEWTDKLGAIGEATFDNRILLNPTHAGSARDAAEAFLHETLHNRLQWIVMATGHDLRIEGVTKDPKTQKYFQDFIQKFRKDHPEIVEHMDQLNRIRYEALNQFRNSRSEVEYQQIKEAVEAGKVQSQDQLLYYGLSNVQEFVAHVPTQEYVASFLNTIPSIQGKTLMSRVMDLFSNMIAALGKAFGFKVKDDSLLREALTHVLNLTAKDVHEDLDLSSALTDSKGAVKVSSEKEAIQVSALMGNTYNRSTTISTDSSDWSVIVNQSKARPVGQRGRMLEKLREQHSTFADALNRLPADKKVERTALQAKLRGVRDQIKTMQQNNDLNVITRIGEAQLKWVDETLKKHNPSIIDVSMAIQTAHMWESLINILYGSVKGVSEINQDFFNLQNQAQLKRMALTNTVGINAVTKEMSKDVKLTNYDFNKNLEDIGGLSANALALVRAKPLLIQSTANLVWKGANSMDESIYRNGKKLEKITTELKNAGILDKLVVKEKDGLYLRNRLTSAWNTKVRGGRERLQESIDGIDASQNLTAEKRIEEKRRVWNEYWDGIRKEATFVDSRVFFDVKTGQRRPEAETKEAFDKLVEQVGNENYAKELIDSAHEKYKKYLTDRDSMNSHLDSVLELTKEEMEGKTPKEQREMLDKLKEEEMKQWLRYNSPIDMLDKLETGRQVGFNSEGDSWIEIAPRKEFEQYYDKDFEHIDSDPAKIKAYNQYKDVLTEMISYLPVEIQSKIPTGFFPIVPKDTAGWLASVMGKIKNWDAALMNSLTATDAEEAARQRPDKIPVMYVDPSRTTREVDQRSDDPIRSLELFSMMALRHKHMGNVLDTVNISEAIMKEVNRQRLAGEQEGKSLEYVLKAVKYLKDAAIFRKPLELEGKVNNAIYSFNQAKQHKIVKEIGALNKELESLEKIRSEKMVEGDFNTDKEDKRIGEIEKKLGEYEKDARYIYGSKLADALIKINQMKAIAWNPMSAVTNYTFAEISLNTYARGKIDYDMRALSQATGDMTHAMKTYWTFGSSRDNISSKIHGLMSRSGIMSDVVETDYGRGQQVKKTRMHDIMDPFNWQRHGDYFTKGKLMVAMMRKHEIEINDPKTGEKKKVSLWECFDENGEWNVEKYGENKDWDTRDGGELFQQFRNRMRKVSMLVFGNQDRNAPVMARKNWGWRLAAQFRLSWFPEGIASRYKAGYHDINLGREIKGRWRSYSDIGPLTSGLIMARQLMAALPGVKMDPFEGVRDKKGKLVSESAVDMENMRKNFAGLAWTASISAAILLLEGLAGNDDDKKAWQRQLLVNMLIRNQQDLMLYSSPGVFNTITGNFMPATQVLTDYWNAITGTAHFVFGDTSHEAHAFKSWVKKITRAGLPVPPATLYNKFETMTTRDISTIQR